MIDPIFNHTELFLRDFGPRRYRLADPHPEARGRRRPRPSDTGNPTRRW